MSKLYKLNQNNFLNAGFYFQLDEALALSLQFDEPIQPSVVSTPPSTPSRPTLPSPRIEQSRNDTSDMARAAAARRNLNSLGGFDNFVPAQPVVQASPRQNYQRAAPTPPRQMTVINNMAPCRLGGGCSNSNYGTVIK